MDCDFRRDPANPRIVRCSRRDCGNVLTVYPDTPVARCHANCRSGEKRSPALTDRELMAQSRRAKTTRNPFSHPCVYQGDPTGESVACGGCGGGVRALFSCDIFASCLPMHVVRGYASCLTCGEYTPEQ